MFLPLQKLSKSRMTLFLGSLLSELQKVLKLAFWKEVQVISGVFKAKILKPQSSPVLPNLHKGGYYSQKTV